MKILEYEPEYAFEVIGEVTAQGEMISKISTMKERLREAAARMGGEAVIVSMKEEMTPLRDDGVAVDSTYAVNVNSILRKKMNGKVIRARR